MLIEVKDLSFFIDVESFCNPNDFKECKIITTKELIKDFEDLKKSHIIYENIEIVEKKDCQNFFNEQVPYQKFLKGRLSYYGNNLLEVKDAELPFILPENIIFNEEYDDLDALETLANEKNCTIFTNRSFKRKSKLVFSYKSYLSLVQKCTILKKASYYIGFDNSELAPLAKKFLKDNTIIFKTGKLTDEQLMFRFINEDNIDFFKI